MASQELNASMSYQDSLSGRIFEVKLDNEKTVSYSWYDIRALVELAAVGHEDTIDIDKITHAACQTMFDGILLKDLEHALVLAAAPFIELDTNYDIVVTRLLGNCIFREVTGISADQKNRSQLYKDSFAKSLRYGVECEIFDKRLLDFDLKYIASHIVPERDDLFKFLGLRTLYTRYLKKFNDVRFELPQAFWMRVAMGLALHEEDKNAKAVEFYDTLSKMLFVSSTPTLLHAGHTISQLSSCYLSYVGDDLHHIFKCIGDNAQMSKWSGGIANDWTAIRATGSMVKSINTSSQGVIPFLKVANSTTASINRSGSRRAAVCAYLEAWHFDFEDFLDLRRNTGDERRRTHDMNTASWIPDLFMKRVMENGTWTLFSPEETPDLHEIYGKKFEERYTYYEEQAAAGKIRLTKTVEAKKLWRKLLTRLFETGHPWPTFKDACNIRSPQDHVGVVHSSNLCTEITLNTSKDETAVCNLGSINLSKMIKDGKINEPLIAKTVKTAMRMLDNVIDLNFYPTKEGKNANMRHRAIGLGMMGLQDALFQLDAPFESQEALEAADNITETVSYHAILSSSELAKERGTYESYKGSKWDRNIFPIDTIALLAKERGMDIPLIGKETKDWSIVRDHVKQYGMRNSNTMAVAPTATISNISGCYPCIEPIFKNLYAKSNSSGEFAVINRYLIDDLKAINLWGAEMRDRIKYYDGSIQEIYEIPEHIRDKYKTAFEIDPIKMIHMTAARGKWIDQSQSHNVFMKGVSGKKLDELYFAGWKAGLKTFYYLRTMGASQIEKSTLNAKKYGFTQMREYKKVEVEKESTTINNTQNESEISEIEAIATKACRLTDPDCESCQ